VQFAEPFPLTGYHHGMPSTPHAAVVIRPAMLADEGALSSLADRLGECPLPAWRTPAEIASADLRAMLSAIRAGDADNAVFVAVRGGAAAGCLHIHTATDFFGRRHAHLSVISVARDAEGTGLADVLMAAAEAWTRDRGLPLLTLNVIDGNARARRFYARHGYEPEIVKFVKPL
jgi:GNAT superfamily N-acetyltransferase